MNIHKVILHKSYEQETPPMKLKVKMLSPLAVIPLTAVVLGTSIGSASALTFNAPPIPGSTLDFGFSVKAKLNMNPMGQLDVDFFQPVGAICTGIAGLPDDNCVTMGPALVNNLPNPAGFFEPFDGLIGSVVDGVVINVNAPTDFLPDIDPFFIYDLAYAGGELDDKFIVETASQPTFIQDGDDAVFTVNFFGTIVDENGVEYKSRLVLGATFQDTLVATIIGQLEDGETIETALDAQQNVQVAAVPEPSTLLSLAGLLGAGFFVKKKKSF